MLALKALFLLSTSLNAQTHTQILNKRKIEQTHTQRSPTFNNQPKETSKIKRELFDHHMRRDIRPKKICEEIERAVQERYLRRMVSEGRRGGMVCEMRSSGEEEWNGL